jgi:hypothetical protein
LLVLAPLVVLALPRLAMAIPAYARKYQASWQTCHVAYPKLNSFGEAFRLRGYRMPGETEALVKQPDVPLGSEGYKKVWPKSVWPGAIPGAVPISIAGDFLVRSSSTLEEEDGEIEQEKVTADFLFPASLELLVGGTAGEHVSYFAEIGYEQVVEDGEFKQEVGVEHFDVRFIAPIKNSLAFNFKVGAFQPELVATFDHARRLTVANYDSMFGVSTIGVGGAESVGGAGHHGGAGGIALPAIARGFDFYGIVAHRFLWTAGIGNGIEPGHDTFDANDRKDMWARVGYKFGGMSLDGHNAATYAGSPKNWREKSLYVGLFSYSGDGSDILFLTEHDGESVFLEDTDYTRIGVDFSWRFQDLHLFGAYVDGDDDLRAFEALQPDPAEPEFEPGPFDPDESGKFGYTSWFVEADVVFPYPWLFGALRYENVDLPKIEDGERVPTWERATVNLTALMRANVKGIVEYTWDLNESKNYAFWLGAGIAF